jgi:hypothetical protein
MSGGHCNTYGRSSSASWCSRDAQGRLLGATIEGMTPPSVSAADPLDVAMSGIVADALSDWDRIQGDVPEMLYHYTDVAGLIGILSSSSVWATNLRFMNDAEELAHSWRLMLDVLHEAKGRARSRAQVELIEEIERAARSEWAGYPDFYATSFTENGDLLSQWRAYGSSGGGYAIGFEASKLVDASSGHAQPDRILNRVIYDEQSQLRVLTATADRMLDLFANVDPTSAAITSARARLFAALGDIVGFVFSFKDPAWGEEQEWRAVRSVPVDERDAVRFRPHGGIPVPYIALAIGNDTQGRLPIREIVLGPRTDNETAARSVELLLAKHGYSDVEITTSSVPLRP